MKRRHFVERDLTSVSGVRWLKAEKERRSAKVNGLFTKWQNLSCCTTSQPAALQGGVIVFFADTEVTMRSR